MLPRTDTPSRLNGSSSVRVEHSSLGSSRRGLQDRDNQRGGSLTETRTEIASAIELSALKPRSRVTVLTAGRDVCGKWLCVWLISGDRWTMVSPDGTVIDVHINHLVALRNVTGKQAYPTCSEQNDHFELPSVMRISVTGCVRDKRPLL